jgi:hypothetical protein
VSFSDVQRKTLTLSLSLTLTLTLTRTICLTLLNLTLTLIQTLTEQLNIKGVLSSYFGYEMGFVQLAPRRKKPNPTKQKKLFIVVSLCVSCTTINICTVTIHMPENVG